MRRLLVKFLDFDAHIWGWNPVIASRSVACGGPIRDSQLTDGYPGTSWKPKNKLPYPTSTIYVEIRAETVIYSSVRTRMIGKVKFYLCTFKRAANKSLNKFEKNNFEFMFQLP